MEDEHEVPVDVRGYVLAHALMVLARDLPPGWSVNIDGTGQLRMEPPVATTAARRGDLE